MFLQMASQTPIKRENIFFQKKKKKKGKNKKKYRKPIGDQTVHDFIVSIKRNV